MLVFNVYHLFCIRLRLTKWLLAVGVKSKDFLVGLSWYRRKFGPSGKLDRMMEDEK